ncbi:MAG: hypothetical protein JNL14_04225 [Devosia sp.]|uniref:hypothetical protein n=1 Tax=Devosia sp. TaxID=1871048 RepID=UPI001A543522|nr:hypothetical protein [Devosia sp.]MBL8596924.1 hypothetical protein [Devosia sp.]
MHDLATIHSPGAADALLVEAAALRAQPQFDAAVIAYCAGLVRFREQTRLMSKLNANETRLRVVGYLLHLSSVSRQAGGDGGVSYGTLRDISAGEVSDRVLKTMLALLQVLGLVECWRSVSDRRVKYYRPSPRTLELARHVCQQRRGARLHRTGRRTRATAGPRSGVLQPHAGRGRTGACGRSTGQPHARFHRLLRRARRGRGGLHPSAAGALTGSPVDSRAALARQFGLSKSQVADVIAAGVGLGYFSLDPTALPTPTPALRDHLTRWISIELAFMARHLRADGPSSQHNDDIRRKHA